MRLPPRPVLLIALLVFLAFGVAGETIGVVVQYACIGYAILMVITFALPAFRAYTVDLPPTATGYVLITGCTSGLGKDMATLFAKRGWNLVLVARDRRALDAFADQLAKENAPIKIEKVVQDLATNDAVPNVVAQLKQKGFDLENANSEKFIDILINNAGFAHVDVVLAAPLSSLQSMITLHLSTIVGLTHAILPGMVARQRGRVAVISSMIAHIPSPRAAVYGGTKAFLTSFTRSLAYEVSLEVDKMTRGAVNTRAPKPNLSVVLITPGATQTHFASAASIDTSLIFRLPLLSTPSGIVSKEIVEGVIEGKSEIQLGWLNRLTIFLLPKLPSKIGHLISFFLWGTGDVRKDFFSSPLSNANKKE